MNKKRRAIFDKSGGKCWYCGCDLPEKGWHEDHVEPVYRNPPKKKPSYPWGEPPESIRPILESSMQKPENDIEENKVPACAPCNLFKSTFSVEEFRQEIQRQVERARKSSVNFRTSERFGLIKEIDKKVTFWFETNN